MLQLFNFAQGTVSTGYDAAATSIALTSGHGARFPSVGPFRCVWWNSTDYPNPADDPNREIVEVTARSTDTLTITRGKETSYGGLAASTKNTASKTYAIALVRSAEQQQEIESYFSGAGFLFVEPYWSGANSGAASANQIANFSSSFLLNPIRQLDTGTDATSGACVFAWDANGLGSARGDFDPALMNWMEIGCDIWIPTLSDGTDTFRVRAAISHLRSNAATDFTDAVYVDIQGSGVTVVAEASSSETSNGSGTVSAATLHKLRLRWNCVAGTVQGWLDDVLVGTVSTGLPTTTAIRGFQADIGILKSAGTTSRQLFVGRQYFSGMFL